MPSSRPAPAKVPPREALRHLGEVLGARRTWRLLAAKLNHDRLLLRASALSYDTLLALVPLLAVSMGSVGIFGGRASLASMLRELARFYVPSSAGEAVSRLIEMAETLDFHAIGALGLIALLPVVFALLDAVELALADIFGMPRRTHWWRLWLLGMLLSLAPLIAVLSVRYIAFAANPWLQSMLAMVLLCSMLYAVFRRMPRVRISRRASAMGALSASLILGLVKIGFGIYAQLAVSLHVLWGAIVFLPLFLVWVLLGWFAVLFATAVASVLHRELRRLDDTTPPKPRRRRSRLRRRLLDRALSTAPAPVAVTPPPSP